MQQDIQILKQKCSDDRPMSWPSLVKLGSRMGVDHGGDRGDKSPQNLERGTLMQIVPPPQILSYGYKNERSVAFKIRQNPFSAGALPQTPLGELTTLPQNP